jgi:hypothetical protein
MHKPPVLFNGYPFQILSAFIAASLAVTISDSVPESHIAQKRPTLEDMHDLDIGSFF